MDFLVQIIWIVDMSFVCDLSCASFYLFCIAYLLQLKQKKQFVCPKISFYKALNTLEWFFRMFYRRLES